MLCYASLYKMLFYLLASASLEIAADDIVKPAGSPFLSCTAEVTGVCAPLGAGVLTLVAGALLLCCMCALTRWPAARALHRDNSPASTPAATMRANLRALSPGFVGWDPLTPSRSSIAL